MSKKIVMLGGRRAGKSSILASVLSCMKNELSDIGVNAQEDLSSSMTANTKTLNDKSNELIWYIDSKSDSPAQFVVDTNPTTGAATYSLKIGQAGNETAKTFEFIDMNGEWMKPNSPEALKKREDGLSNHDWLISQVNEGDVFIVAIDTPYLFEKKSICTVYNQIEEISDILQNIQFKQEEVDKKMIIFCPVKAEKYFDNGTIDEVTEKVKQVYKNVIDKWIGKNVKMLIMPIKTAGGLEFVKMRTPVKYYKDDKEQISTMCGIDIDADITDLNIKIYAENGGIKKRTASSIIEWPKQGDPDFDKWMFNNYVIPKAWYRCNGKGYAPEYCEQPALRMLKFLLDKDTAVQELQQTCEEIEKQGGNGGDYSNTYFGRLFKSVGKVIKSAGEVLAAILNIRPIFDKKQKEVFEDIWSKVESKGKLKSYPGYCEITGGITNDYNN